MDLIVSSRITIFVPNFKNFKYVTMEREMKRCPYCGETILAVAKKCRYCGEWLDKPLTKETAQVRPPFTSSVDLAKSNIEDKGVNDVDEELEENIPGWIEYFFYQPFIKHYCDFKSSIGRKHFWICMLWTALFTNAIFGLAFLLVDKHVTFLDSSRTLLQISLVFLVVELAIIIPSLALYVRRLRDAELSWKWVLSLFIPYIGPLILVIKLCKSGDLECGTSKAKLIDYIAIVVCSLLIVFGYSQGMPYMFDTIKMWQEYPSKMSYPDLNVVDEDTLSVDTMDVNNQENLEETDGSDESVTTTNVDSNDDEYAWLCMRYAEPEDLENKSSRELRIMRNYIFARHGYIFKSDDLRQYFSQYDWYTPISRNVTKELSKI